MGHGIIPASEPESMWVAALLDIFSACLSQERFPTANGLGRTFGDGILVLFVVPMKDKVMKICVV